jgi:hypothetical protein
MVHGSHQEASDAAYFPEKEIAPMSSAELAEFVFG